MKARKTAQANRPASSTSKAKIDVSADGIRRVVQKMPLVPLEQLHAGQEPDSLLTLRGQLVAAIMAHVDPEAAAKATALSGLDDFSHVEWRTSEVSFLLGVEYGRRLALDEQIGALDTATQRALLQLVAATQGGGR